MQTRGWGLPRKACVGRVLEWTLREHNRIVIKFSGDISVEQVGGLDKSWTSFTGPSLITDPA